VCFITITTSLYYHNRSVLSPSLPVCIITITTSLFYHHHYQTVLSQPVYFITITTSQFCHYHHQSVLSPTQPVCFTTITTSLFRHYHHQSLLSLSPPVCFITIRKQLLNNSSHFFRPHERPYNRTLTHAHSTEFRVLSLRRVRKFRNTTISFIKSVCQSAWNNSSPSERIFTKSDI
jgi:hypothetical protein